MSKLLTPLTIGSLEIKNRFVQSATYESMAKPDGTVTDALIKRYRNLAMGKAGLVIPGLMFVHPLGKSCKYQTGIHKDDMIPGLSCLTEAVKTNGGKIIFQLCHSGQQTNKNIIGQKPMGPSSAVRDPIFFFKPRKMDPKEIKTAIQSFGQSARRAFEAGADGIQIHAAHGYLINEFLSPFFNKRTDEWGGSDENRFRFLKEVIQEVNDKAPGINAVIIKISTKDFIPTRGITPDLAEAYIHMLKEVGIDGVEISCGSTNFSFMNMSRGQVPVKELSQSFPWWMKPLAKMKLQYMSGKYDLEEGYNLEAAKQLKPVLADIPLILVGGLRRFSHMETILENNWADAISMCRPFIREPFLVSKYENNKIERVSCISCNRCLAAIVNEFPVQCYRDDFPQKRK
jgi:2,4-dienoyl-CoA reductase-like NADH-dependent reductase (Old Yellow Enzyme family)